MKDLFSFVYVKKSSKLKIECVPSQKKLFCSTSSSQSFQNLKLSANISIKLLFSLFSIFWVKSFFWVSFISMFMRFTSCSGLILVLFSCKQGLSSPICCWLLLKTAEGRTFISLSFSIFSLKFAEHLERSLLRTSQINSSLFSFFKRLLIAVQESDISRPITARKRFFTVCWVLPGKIFEISDQLFFLLSDSSSNWISSSEDNVSLLNSNINILKSWNYIKLKILKIKKVVFGKIQENSFFSSSKFQ